MQHNQVTPSLSHSKPHRLPTDNSCFSLIWSRGVGQHNKALVLQNTRETSGVISARFTCETPYILLVNYDPQITNATTILNSTRCNITDAKIVGSKIVGC